jgi:hypothetical protein
MLNPVAGLPVTCTWQCHINHHNSDLGDDSGASVGTPIRAPFNGTLRNVIRQESPVLYIAFLTSDDDPSLECEVMHLSRFAPAGHYLEGQTMGWSGGAVGAVGSGHATGPHIHINAVVNGVLTPWGNVLSQFASVGTPVLLTPPASPTPSTLLEDNDMNGLKWVINPAHPATPAADSKTYTPGSFWWQDNPGSPVRKLTDGERSALDNMWQQNHWADYNASPRTISPVYPTMNINGADMALIAAGIVNPVSGGTVGSVDLSGVLTAEAATLAAVKAIPAPLTKIISTLS